MQEDHCFLIAGALSYFSLLAIVPLTVVALAAFAVSDSFLKAQALLQQAFEGFLQSGLVPPGGELEMVMRNAGEFARRALASSGTAGAVGAVVFVLAAYPLVDNVERVFSVIWRAERRRAMWARFLSFWLVAGLGPVILAALLLVFAQVGSHVEGWLDHGPFAMVAAAGRHLSVLVAPAVVWGALLLVYTVVPARTSPWKALLAGSLTAAGLWEGARFGFGLYVKHVLPVGKVYGALGVIPVLMMWLYLSWSIVLLGGEVVNAVEEHDLYLRARRAPAREKGKPAPPAEAPRPESEAPA